MPRQFGPFMVPSNSSVQHMKKVKKETSEREQKLAQWEREKAARVDRLRVQGTAAANRSRNPSPTPSPAATPPPRAATPSASRPPPTSLSVDQRLSEHADPAVSREVPAGSGARASDDVAAASSSTVMKASASMPDLGKARQKRKAARGDKDAAADGSSAKGAVCSVQ